MRHAGMGFPNGPVSNDVVFSLPSPDLLMLSTEGRYHHDAAVRAGKRVLWRAVPRIGKRPAELGWSPSRFVDEALNLTDEPAEPIRDFVFANELDLQDERGDGDDDWSGLEQRYRLIGGWGRAVVAGLRAALPETRLHWPAWTPDHHAITHLDHWREAAEACDVVDFHAYDALGKIMAEYHLYRAAFPCKPLALTEWHCRGDLEEERRVLAWLAETMRDDPLFEAAYFFIWRWHGAPGWWSDAWDIEHSADRLALFADPPTASQPAPPAVPEPPMPELPFGIDVSNNNGHIDWARVAEAGVAFAIAKVSEGTWFRDGYFAENWQAMKAHGILRGAYHFARPSAAGAVDEARYFVAAIGLLGQQLEPGDLVALDLEDEQAGGDLSGWTLAWLQEVERLVGYKPLIYTSPAYAQAHQLARRPEIGEYGLWLASWGVPTPPAAPAPWDLVAIHQYGVGGVGSVPGVAGECDLNRYNGPLETLALYGKPGSVEPPPQQPADDEVVAGLRVAVAHLCDVVVPRAAGAAAEREAALAEAAAIREQFVGPKPAA